MKKFGLVAMGVLLIVGCGSSDNSTPARDGKGEIDVITYLPQKDMLKKFEGGISGAIFVHYEATIDVSVTNNIIIENIHSKSVFRGYANYADSSRKTVYNDFNITETYIGKNKDQKINTYFRYVDIDEVQNEVNEKNIYDYVDYAQNDLVIGKSEIITYKQCKYGKENNANYYDKEGEKGDFLTIICKVKKEKILYVDNEFLELNDEYTQKNGEKEIIEESITTYYYQKDIGYYGFYIQNLYQKNIIYNSESLIKITYK